MSRYLLKLAEQLFSDAQEREVFISALSTPAYARQSLVWIKEKPDPEPFELQPKAVFQPDFVDCVQEGQKPGSSALHQQGYFYCLDLSSVFAAAIFFGIKQPAFSILDMCASPGGKSIIAWRFFKPERLICNEVIGKRHAALVSNLKRLSIEPVSVTQLDSSYWSKNSANSFDLVICDVPCSGQSLLVKGKISPGCFHPATINMNSNRQKRIIANSVKCVAEGGHLAYMTCTYSAKENEEIVAWTLKKFPEFQAVEVEELQGFRSKLCEFPAYRLWPHQFSGAGAFSCLLKRQAQ